MGGVSVANASMAALTRMMVGAPAQQSVDLTKKLLAVGATEAAQAQKQATTNAILDVYA
jgi:hypothetical protein